MNILLLQDGSRRWSREHGLTYDEGYKQTVKRLSELYEWLYEQGITEIWTGICGLGNLKRPPEQVRSFLTRFLEAQDYTKLKLGFTVRGRLDALPDDFGERYKALPTPKGKDFTVHYSIGWTTDDELVQAFKYVREHPDMPLDIEHIRELCAVPEPIDLLIRAGKHQRLSSMFPWHSGYTTIYFANKLFPDFTVEDLAEAINLYKKDTQNYGL